MIHKYCWFSHCAFDYTILQVFQKEDLCLFQDLDLQLLTVDNFIRSTAVFRDNNFLATSILDAWNLYSFVLYIFEFLSFLVFLDAKIFIPPREFKFLLWL